MSELPEGWEWSTIGEVTLPIEKHDPRKSPDAAIEYIDIGGIDGDRLRIESTKKYLGSEAPSRARQLVESGDTVLSTVRVNLSKTALVPPSLDGATASTGFSVLRPCDAVHPEFLFHHVTHQPFVNALAEQQTGSSYPAVRDRDVRAMPIPVPPLPEQRRIVAAIEEHFSRLDSAEADAKSAVRRAKVLAQSLIDSSLRGPAAKLGDLLAEPLRNGLSAKSSPTGTTRVLTLTAVTDSSFTEQNTKLIDSPGRSMDDLWLQPDDIFIQRSNTPELVGAAAIYKGPAEWAIFPDLLIRVRVGEAARADYVALALRSSASRSFFRRSAQGIAGSMPKISQPVVEQAEIPLPSVQQQDDIIIRYAASSEEVARLQRQAGIALIRLRSLRRSILAAAFSGRLVPQDLSDEPAAVLLERIAAERVATNPTRKKKVAS